MAFSEGISRLQRIINLISIDYRSKKEIMAYLREYNIIISYKTLERDLKQIKEELGFDLEYKRNVGYRCENENVLQTESMTIDSNMCKVGFENELYTIINVFNHNGKTYCNFMDKRNKKVILVVTT
jgi:arginine repressor